MATYLGEDNTEIKPEAGRQNINSEPATSIKLTGFDEMAQVVVFMPLPAG